MANNATPDPTHRISGSTRGLVIGQSAVGCFLGPVTKESCLSVSARSAKGTENIWMFKDPGPGCLYYEQDMKDMLDESSIGLDNPGFSVNKKI